MLLTVVQKNVLITGVLILVICVENQKVGMQLCRSHIHCLKQLAIGWRENLMNSWDPWPKSRCFRNSGPNVSEYKNAVTAKTKTA